MLKAIETQYKGYRFRSRLEARWAVFFDALGIEWEYEKEGFDLGDAGWYLPDFWLPDAQTWVEVKGIEPTDDELAKAEALCVASQSPVLIHSGLPNPEFRGGTLFSPKEEWVYLAGRIGKNDWRHSIVSHLDSGSDDGDIPNHWNPQRCAIGNRHHYTGPFFISCDHGCYHGEGQHGVGAVQTGCMGGEGTTYDREFNTWLANVSAIDHATLVFAWIDSKDAYGTLAEIGYAGHKRYGLGGCAPDPLVVIGTPEYNPDLWFVYQFADHLAFAPDAASAIVPYLDPRAVSTCQIDARICRQCYSLAFVDGENVLWPEICDCGAGVVWASEEASLFAKATKAARLARFEHGENGAPKD